MLSALLSFLGGSAFRMIWGEVSAFLSRRQEHAHEIERMRLQEEMTAAQHARNLDAIRLQADLGVKVIEVARDAELAMVEASAWERAVDQVGRLTGIKVIDLWNQSIRPLLATLAILVVVGEVIAAGFVLTDWTRDLVAAILGLYVADRSLSKRGK